MLQSTAGRSSDWRLWRHGVAVVEAGVAGGGAAPPDCSSPRRISGPAGPLLSSPLSSLPFSLNWRGRGLRRACAGYTPAISRARLALPFPCARLAPAPSHASFPAVFLASARLPARRGVRRTPWRRLSSRGDAIRQKVMAGWTPRFRNRPDDKATPRRRHGDAIKTMGATPPRLRRR